MFTCNKRQNISRILGATLAGCVVLTLCWATLALSGSALANPPDGNGNHNHGGGGGTIPVTVTFEDLLGDGLTSDCGTGDCPYIHKVDKVSTGIGTSGNFFMKLTKGNQPAIRTLFLDFSDCVSPPDQCEQPLLCPFPDQCDQLVEGQGFTVGAANVFTSGINLREMKVDETDVLSLMVSFDLTSVGAGVWNLIFDPLNADCPDSSNIAVTKTGDNPDTWMIEARENDVACLAGLLEPGDGFPRGLYHMPFKLTVQKK